MHRSAELVRFLNDHARQAELFSAGQRLRDEWLASPPAVRLAGVLQQLSEHPPSGPAAFRRRLGAVTGDPFWVRQLTDCWLAALRADMFADLPWQSQQTAAIQGLTLMQRARASCSLIVVDGDMLTGLSLDKVVFDHGMTLLWLLSGELQVSCYRRIEGAKTISAGRQVMLRTGHIVASDCARRQWVMTAGNGDCILLRISLACGPPGARVAEYSTRTGQLVRQGCSDGATSRMLALLDVAAQAGADELLPLLADLAAHPDPALRWQAMRLWVARDAARARNQLAAMSVTDVDDGIRSVALTTLAIIDAATADPSLQELEQAA